MLDRQGYRPSQVGAVLAASAAMGETVPPSIALIVLGSATTLSVGALFLAGILPAVVLAAALMLWIYARARLTGQHPEPRASWGERGRATLRGVPALFLPVILLGGIVGGVGTPTEVSSFAVIYGLFLAGFIYRDLSLKTLWKTVTETCVLSGMLLFMISAATAFS